MTRSSRRSRTRCTPSIVTRPRSAPAGCCSFRARSARTPDGARPPAGRASRGAGGGSFDAVVDTTLFLIDPEGDFATLQTVMADYWGVAPYPALTGIGVNWLAGFRFEIKVIAKLPETGAEA